MPDPFEPGLFGPASRCASFEHAKAFLGVLVGEDAIRTTSAYAMLLAARSVEGGAFRDDALEVLTRLGYAKAELDALQCHTPPTTEVTADILSSAQQAAAELTAPCTQWPTSEDIVACVERVAREHAGALSWRRVIRDERGAVVGAEEIDPTS